MAPAAKHRESLIAASAALLQRQGYAATGLAEILAESGAPRGSLYHYFPEGKEEIAEAALRLAGATTEKRIREGAARVPDPRAFAIGYGEAVSHMMSKSEYSRGCPLATVALEATPQSPRLTAVAREIFASWSAAIAEMLVATGIAAPRALELADFMLASIEGAMILARVRQSTEPVMNAAAQVAAAFDHELGTRRNVQ